MAFRRVPTVVQQEDSESGAVCLGMVLAGFGRTATPAQLRAACRVGRDGVSPRDLAAAAQSFGMNAEVKFCEPDDLRSGEPPVIVHWGFTGYVVVEGWRADRWLLHDPVLGRRECTDDEFAESFTGAVVVVDAEPIRTRRPTGPLRRLLASTPHVGAVVAFMALIGALLVVPTLLVPRLIRLFADGLTGEASIAVGAAVLGLVLAAVVQGLLLFLQGQAAVDLVNASIRRLREAVVQHLLGVPLAWFDRRSVASAGQRVSLPSAISDGLSDLLTTGLGGLFTGVTGLLVLLLIDRLTGVVALVFTGLGLLAVHLVLRRDRDTAARSLHESLRMGVVVGSTLSGIRGVKAGGHEQGLTVLGVAAHHRLLRAEQRQSLRFLGLRLLPILLGSLGTVVVAGTAAVQVQRGVITAPGFAAVLVVTALAITPLVTSATSFEQSQVLTVALDRIDDAVAVEPVRPSPAVRPLLTGRVQVRNLEYRYEPWASPVLSGISFDVPAGSWHAVAMAGGSGGTALARVLAGLLPPAAGSVLIDDHPADHLLGTGAVQYVALDPPTSELSVREAVTSLSESVSESSWQAAVADSGLASLLRRRPEGAGLALTEDAKNLSLGERQCLAIATALAHDPQVLILDGVTHALDRPTRRHVLAALERRGTTCVFLAPQPVDAAECDSVTWLVDGRVVATGTHESLLADCPDYADLMDPR